jgi:SAM-dependent methyltransferase
MTPRRPFPAQRRQAFCCHGIWLTVGLLISAPPVWSAPSPTKALDVPYVPTPPEVVQEMLTLAKVQRGETVYDLGSGDGRVVIAAAERFGARGLGVDLDPERIAEARVNARRARVDGRVEFRQADLFTIDLRPANVLTMYLLGEVNVKLRPKILSQLRPGARVVSHDFDMDEWKPDDQRRVGEHRVYLWIVPARVAGTWAWTLPLTSGPRPYQINLDQKFQQVEGTALAVGTETDEGTRTSARELPVSEARLAGEQLAFTIRDPGGADRPALIMQYQGKVSEGTAEGVVTILDGASSAQVPWIARLMNRR